MTHGSLNNNNNKTEGVGQINAAVPVLLKISAMECIITKRKKGEKKEAHFQVSEGVSLRALIDLCVERRKTTFVFFSLSNTELSKSLKPRKEEKSTEN